MKNRRLVSQWNMLNWDIVAVTGEGKELEMLKTGEPHGTWVIAEGGGKQDTSKMVG